MTTRSDVAAEVGAELGTVIGDSNKTSHGLPNPFEPSGYPYAVYYVGEPAFEQITMGLTGTIEYTYDVEIWIFLGKLDADRPRIAAAGLANADKMRAQFAGNVTLAGNVFNCDLTEGNNNIKTYLEDGDRPQQTYRLRLTEHRARNSIAS